MKQQIDDFLGLLSRSFKDRRLIVFTGMSGSGKTTSIDLLIAEHPEFNNEAVSRIGPTPIDWSMASPSTELVVVDELQRVGELANVIRLLRAGHRLIVASHLPVLFIHLLGLRWRVQHFHTDRSTEKIARYLDSLGVSHSPGSIREFGRQFGANFTDVDIVLEFSGVDDFDLAFTRFQRFASLTLN